VLATRTDKTSVGNVHFSMKPLLTNQGGVADALTRSVYSAQALVPESPWLAGEVPQTPRLRLASDGTARLRACFGDSTFTPPRWWVLRVKRGNAWSTQVLPGGTRSVTLPSLGPADIAALSAVDRTGREGAAGVGERADEC